MKLITEQIQIKNILITWQKIHFYNNKWQNILWQNAPFNNTKIIYKQLEQLDLKIATAKDIAEIVGHTGMTTIECDECNKVVNEYIILGEIDETTNDVGCDFDKATVCICKNCFQTGLNLFNHSN